jgi:hypothetical protein
MDSFSATLTKLKGRRLSRKSFGQFSILDLKEFWSPMCVVREGGFENPQAKNDDGSEEFNVIDISKLKAVGS